MLHYYSLAPLIQARKKWGRVSALWRLSLLQKRVHMNFGVFWTMNCLWLGGVRIIEMSIRRALTEFTSFSLRQTTLYNCQYIVRTFPNSHAWITIRYWLITCWCALGAGYFVFTIIVYFCSFFYSERRFAMSEQKVTSMPVL